MRTKNALLITFALSILSFNTIAQSFDRYKDNSNKCSVIRYYKLDYQFVIEKRIPFDTTLNSYFVLGIYINTKKFTLIDSFMRTGGSIIFESGNRIDFESEHSIADFERGFAAVRHQLTKTEFELVSTEIISHFIVIGVKKEFDKYQRQHIFKAILKLQTEQY